MRVYLDASVLAAIILQQPASPKQRDWLRRNATERPISSFTLSEFVDAIARQVRRHMLTVEEGAGIVASVEASARSWSRHTTLDADIVDGASLIAADMTRGLKLGDAIHLAVCRRLGATLLTGDRRQAAAATAFDIPAHLILPNPES